MTAPQAAIKVFAPDGEQIFSFFAEAPLQLYQIFTRDGATYTVVDVSWPHRTDDNRCPVDTDYDWEHVTVSSVAFDPPEEGEL